jgi:hypothetical protein
MRSQRSGVLRIRRNDGTPLASRYFEVTPLAAIMKSSMSSLARFFSSGSRSAITSPLKSARVWIVSRLRRLAGGVAASSPAPYGLEAQELGQPAHRRELRRRRCCAVEPGGDRVVRELRTIEHDGAIDGRLDDGAVGADGHLDDERQPLFSLVERGQVGGELLGSIGKICAAV